MHVLALAGLLLPAAVAAPAPSHRTDWFFRAGYGVFVHYLWDLQNVPETVNGLGRSTSWDACVREFDVERFADQMKQAGAGYVIFTMHQRTRYLIAPNATFDRMTGYHPGEACATRDLVDDLYRALSRRGVPLMLYWTGDGPREDPKAAAALQWPADGKVTEEFVRNWAAVAREYGERYGDKVKGWWCDGCYPFIGYTDATLGIMAGALRAGYPQRIVALNNGVLDRVRPYTRHEDYTTGEQNAFADVPVSRFVDGEQWHVLSFLGGAWGRAGTRLSKQQLVDYVFACSAVGGVVSIDVLLYRDGTIDRSQLEVLKALRPGLAVRRREADAWRRGKAIPPRNKAWRKPAALLSLKGYRLGPSVGEQHEARAAVDGDPVTSAEAGGEYAWALDVDLLEPGPIRRIAVTFGRGYATDFDVAVSEDREHWSVIRRFQGHDGSPVDLACDVARARFVRVRGYRPDAEGQPGTQMQVADLRVYE
ncbi:MAG: alpha-L-fucosidase [Chthonomonadales bacterium]|nr:alpha-L-fucosidase [Chthonomonadales bacterium]